jgi:very-short-patch-repair endonuclease
MTSPIETLLLGQLQAAGLPTPERELTFHPQRQWRFDLAWPAAMVAVEIDGGIWSAGRHVRPKGYEDDARKCNEAAVAGWTVLRVTGGMVKSNETRQLIERALARFMVEAAA